MRKWTRMMAFSGLGLLTLGIVCATVLYTVHRGAVSSSLLTISLWSGAANVTLSVAEDGSLVSITHKVSDGSYVDVSRHYDGELRKLAYAPVLKEASMAEEYRKSSVSMSRVYRSPDGRKLAGLLLSPPLCEDPSVDRPEMVLLSFVETTSKPIRDDQPGGEGQ